MPILTFKSPEGKQIQVNSPDGSMPSEGELDQLFAMSTGSTSDRSKFETPEYQGGATSPANVKAQGDLQKAQQDASPGGFFKNHPILSMLQGGPELVTGKSLSQTVDENSNKTDITPEQAEAYKKKWGEYPSDFNKLNTLDRFKKIGAEAIDMATSPSNVIIPGISKLAAIPAEAGAGLVSKALVDPIKNVIKYSNPKIVAKLADDVDSSLLMSRNKVVDNYGPEYKSIIGKSEQKVNLADPIKNLIEESDSVLQNAEFANSPQAKRILGLVDVVKNDSTLENISAQEADNIQKAIKQLPSIKTKLQKAATSGKHTVDWTNDERILLDFSNDIKSKVIEAHPELVNLNKGYGDFMNSYKKVRGSFGVKKTENLMRNFNNEEQVPQRFKDLLEGVLPEDSINKISQYSDAVSTGKILKTLGLLGGGAALGSVGLGKAKELLH